MGFFSKKPQWKKNAEKQPLTRNEIHWALGPIIAKMRKDQNDKNANEDCEILYRNIVQWNGGGVIDDYRRLGFGDNAPQKKTQLDKELEWFQKKIQTLMKLSDVEWKKQFDESGNELTNCPKCNHKASEHIFDEGLKKGNQWFCVGNVCKCTEEY